MNYLIEAKVGTLSLNDPVDTTTSHGSLIFNIFALLAEFERDNYLYMKEPEQAC